MPNSTTNPLGVPEDVAAIRKEIRSFLNRPALNGLKIGNAKWGVYAFFDYDGEPIYVGQTNESLRSRIGRHLTNQRTDAVAMNVLDPFEVAEIEVWPLWDFQEYSSGNPDAKQMLNAAEYTVFQQVLSGSAFSAVLNEGDIPPTDRIQLPESTRGKIIPDKLFVLRKHPDIRIARRATTIAALARVISERDVSTGLRRTLVTQARRLERLAAQRFEELGGLAPLIEPGEEV
jgi:GIY-YIG catalytic domain